MIIDKTIRVVIDRGKWEVVYYFIKITMVINQMKTCGEIVYDQIIINKVMDTLSSRFDLRWKKHKKEGWIVFLFSPCSLNKISWQILNARLESDSESKEYQRIKLLRVRE